MELVNTTDLMVGWTVAFQPDGRELVIVAAKGTFELSGGDGEPGLAKEQAALTEADQFSGAPGFSSTLYESDYAHQKPRCDVLVNGSAYGANQELVDRTSVGLSIGPIQKRFEVVGERVWDYVLLLGAVPTPPVPFFKMPISYDRAYGGIDSSERSPGSKRTYLQNPVGVGYYPLSETRALIGKPLANTHQLGSPAESLKGAFQPMSFGAMSRNFKSRMQFAGTYDQNWLDHHMPFFPSDFDYRYFQCAPEDQQMAYPVGGEIVTLENLTSDGVTRFQIPRISVPVLFTRHRGAPTQVDGAIDTILIEPEANRFMITWRACMPVRKTCFEIRQVVVGKTLASYRREDLYPSKKRYANLEEFIRAKKRGETR